METKTRIEDLPTVYDAQSTEDKMYKFWANGQYFKANAKSIKPAFSMVIPPIALILLNCVNAVGFVPAVASVP